MFSQDIELSAFLKSMLASLGNSISKQLQRRIKVSSFSSGSNAYTI